MTTSPIMVASETLERRIADRLTLRLERRARADEYRRQRRQRAPGDNAYARHMRRRRDAALANRSST